MELHETPQQTVKRESREECGFVLDPGRVTVRAIQFAYSTEEKEYFEKVCEFVEAELIGLVAPAEDDHELFWLDLEQALKALSHESHRWAVACAGRRV
jgi:8-oxo-dGTP diphosphatase